LFEAQLHLRTAGGISQLLQQGDVHLINYRRQSITTVLQLNRTATTGSAHTHTDGTSIQRWITAGSIQQDDLSGLVLVVEIIVIEDFATAVGSGDGDDVASILNDVAVDLLLQLGITIVL
jgi:hypothetical protein